MTQPPPADDSAAKPPRFGLSSLMLAITALAVCFASFHYLGTHATALAILLGLAVIAHVAGNAIGTSLRDRGNAERQPKPSPSSGEARIDFAPPTRLRRKAPLGFFIVAITVLGMLGGGLTGGLAFAYLLDAPVTITGIACGSTAAAVLGGIWTFAAASFLQVAGGALWQAMRDPKQQR